MTTIAPYGTWTSPVTPALVVGKTIGLSSVTADGGEVYWLESRPTEGGRSVLVRRGADGAIADITPAPLDVASRVHEYGGGAYTVDGGRILFSNKADGGVWLAGAGAAPRRIAGVPGCRYADFRFMPGGRGAVCVREDHRDRPPSDPQAAIVLLSLDPQGEAQEGEVLVVGPDFLAAPRPSLDGSELAWIAWDHPDMPWDATRLQVAAFGPDGLGAARVLAGAGRDESLMQPEWSPQGVLHYISDRTGWWNIYRADGTPLCPVDAEIGGPAWVFGQRFFTFLPDGRVLAQVVRQGAASLALIEGGRLQPLALPPCGQCPALVAEGGALPSLACVVVPPDAPPAVVLARPEVGGWAGFETLRASAPAELRPADISLGEAFSFPTGEGEEAHAFWYPPANAGFAGPAGETPPLVVMGHGGPTGMTGNGFSPRIQWWTSRGFGVVDVNYRGSTGFGRAYRHRLDGEWGVVDVQDCIAAAEHLVAQGKVDPKRLAIRGGSAGGFTVLAALTTSRVFSAGASLYGIGDLMLLAHDTHKFEARYLDRLIGKLPEQAAVYAERSPINHVDALGCGVIFFQGLEDKVVPPNQARIFVQAMRERGLPVAHYEFEGEGHGFRRADTLVRVLELELDFYATLFGFRPAGAGEQVALLPPL